MFILLQFEIMAFLKSVFIFIKNNSGKEAGEDPPPRAAEPGAGCAVLVQIPSVCPWRTAGTGRTRPVVPGQLIPQRLSCISTLRQVKSLSKRVMYDCLTRDAYEHIREQLCWLWVSTQTGGKGNRGDRLQRGFGVFCFVFYCFSSSERKGLVGKCSAW